MVLDIDWVSAVDHLHEDSMERSKVGLAHPLYPFETETQLALLLVHFSRLVPPARRPRHRHWYRQSNRECLVRGTSQELPRPHRILWDHLYDHHYPILRIPET